MRFIQNDKGNSYSGDQILHILDGRHPSTLCGIYYSRYPYVWFTQPTEYLGGATLCAKCERSANKRGLEIK